MAGELIQMNAHMVTTGEASLMVCVGMTALLVFAVLAALAAREKERPHRLFYTSFFAVIAIVGLVVLIVGANRPRVKEIRACVNGPLSLEQVAAVYDIVEIDGKELTLRER